MSDAMIEIDNLSRYYGPTRALDRIRLRVNQGEVMGFLGPNGAGKTTTMRILAGILAPSEGEVRVAGIDLLDNPVEARAQVGYLPENPPIYHEMTVREYLTYLAALRRVPAHARKNAVDRTMERCGLTAVSERLLANLSKGYRQRAGIAQAIVHSPRVVILDEPTVGLDPIQIREIRALIRELGGEHSVLLSTHILPEVKMTCNRVAVIHQGRIVLEETLAGLEEKTRHRQGLRLRMNRPPPDSDLAAIPGVGSVRREEGGEWLLDPAPGADPLPELLRRAVAGDWDLREVAPSFQSLEEIFVQLAGGDAEESDNGKESTP